MCGCVCVYRVVSGSCVFMREWVCCVWSRVCVGVCACVGVCGWVCSVRVCVCACVDVCAWMCAVWYVQFVRHSDWAQFSLVVYAFRTKRNKIRSSGIGTVSAKAHYCRGIFVI